MFSLYPSCSGGAHCQEDQPASNPSAPSQPACSTGAQSPIRALLWADLVACPREGKKSGPSSRYSIQCRSQENQDTESALQGCSLISPTPSPCLLVILVRRPWQFLVPLPSASLLAFLSPVHNSAGATGQQKAAVTEGMPLTHPDSPLRNLSLASCSRGLNHTNQKPSCLALSLPHPKGPGSRRSWPSFHIG